MKKFKFILEIGFYSGFSLGVYSLYKTFIANKNLPAGVCPVDNYRWMMYLSVGILLVSMGIQEIIKRKQI